MGFSLALCNHICCVLAEMFSLFSWTATLDKMFSLKMNNDFSWERKRKKMKQHHQRWFEKGYRYLTSHASIKISITVESMIYFYLVCVSLLMELIGGSHFKKSCILFKYIISMGPKNLKEMLGQERESSGEVSRKRTGDCIQWEYYIAIDKTIHEKVFDCCCHGNRKHLKKSIKAYFGMDPNAILYVHVEKDRRCKYLWERQLYCHVALSEKNWNIIRIKV